MRAVAKFSCAGYVKGPQFDSAWPSIYKNNNNHVDHNMIETVKRIHAALEKQKK
jgi:hypothetical protein